MSLHAWWAIVPDGLQENDIGDLLETGADHFAKVAIAVKLNEDGEADGHGVYEYGRAGLSILEEERSGSEWKKNALNSPQSI